MVRVAAETETNIGGCPGRDPDHRPSAVGRAWTAPVIAAHRHPDTQQLRRESPGLQPSASATTVRSRMPTQAVALEKRAALPSVAIAQRVFGNFTRPRRGIRARRSSSGAARPESVSCRAARASCLLSWSERQNGRGPEPITCDGRREVCETPAVTLPTLPAHLASSGR
jgi:hypothetical protein